jgi:hypothetical protein
MMRWLHLNLCFALAAQLLQNTYIIVGASAANPEQEQLFMGNVRSMAYVAPTLFSALGQVG